MAHVAIIEPCSSGYAIVEAAAELGHEITIVSANDADRRQPQHVAKLAKRVITVETNDYLQIRHALTKLTANEPIEAIIPGFEYYVATAARLGKHFAVTALCPKAAKRARFKDEMRIALQAHGLQTPKFCITDSPWSLACAATEVGFPAVVKPTDMSGSMGVMKVRDLEDLTKACELAWNHPAVDLGQTQSGRLIVEEYIEGPEYSVEGFISAKGEVSFLSITEKILGEEPYFVELGHLVGANFDQVIVDSIKNYVRDVIKAVDLGFGPFHAELRYNKELGPVLMEVGARLPGDRITDLIKMATGFDMAKGMVSSYLGIDYTPEPGGGKSSGIIFFNNPGLDQIKDVKGVESLEELPSFRTFHLYYKIGDSVPPSTDFLGRLGYAIFCGPNASEVRASMFQARESVTFY